jgi:hypothetical protein
MLSGSPLSFSKSSGEWLWKRWPATLLSVVSSASPVSLPPLCLLVRGDDLGLRLASTQSKRRSTVIGSMTRSYCGGR